LASHIHQYGRRLFNLATQRDQNPGCFGSQSDLNKHQTLAHIFLRKLSLGDFSSPTTKLSEALPIKTLSFGYLTPKQAAEIIIEEKGHFSALKRELKKSGVVTNLGAQQVLLRSLLQARMDEIDAERNACQFPIGRTRKSVKGLSTCNTGSTTA
jgi:hypothetical protein